MESKKESKMRTEEVNEILTAAPKWIFRWGVVVISFVLTLIFLLVYFVKFPETIYSTVTISKKEFLNNEQQYSTQLLVRSSDFNKVKEGQRVNIKLDSYPFMQYGFIQGVVKNISSSIYKNNFVVNVELSNGLKTTFGNILLYQERMTGIGDITVGKSNLIEKLIINGKPGQKNK